MLINQTAEYALRAVAILAPKSGGERTTAAQLAAQANIPGHYVSKVMRRLVVAGLVDALRGHNGGFRLARPAAEIRFIEVLDALDEVPRANACAFGLGDCDEDNPCSLHPAYGALRERFLDWAMTHTLAPPIAD